MPFLGKSWVSENPENAQRNEIAVTFDLCLGLTWSPCNVWGCGDLSFKNYHLQRFRPKLGFFGP